MMQGCRPACGPRWDTRRPATSLVRMSVFRPSEGGRTVEKNTLAEGTRTGDVATSDGLRTLSDRDIIAEFSHQDSLLQAYRQQFLVAETFTAAVAATTVFSNPTIALALAFLGIVILVGWILVTRSRARVLYYWDGKLRLLAGFREVFDRRDLEPLATMWARFWLGGDPIGVFQLAFGVFWAFLIFVALEAVL